MSISTNFALEIDILRGGGDGEQQNFENHVPSDLSFCKWISNDE